MVTYEFKFDVGETVTIKVGRYAGFYGTVTHIHIDDKGVSYRLLVKVDPGVNPGHANVYTENQLEELLTMKIKKKPAENTIVRVPAVHINGWIIEENTYDGFPATKKYISFHPMYDGHYWEQHDTMDEVNAFCTVERLERWHEELL